MKWLVVLVCLAFTGAAAAVSPKRDRPIITQGFSAGRTIYENGILSDGSPLQAQRSDAPNVSGANAACINCHRKSGLGSIEARNIIPPVTARYLYHPPEDSEDAARLPYLPNSRLDRPPYNYESLAAAIREGVDSRGKPLSYLMPRYDLSEADMSALIGHLTTLDSSRVPGVTAEELHFATIVTPDANPTVRDGVLNVIRNFFTERNAAPRVAGSQKLQTSAKGAQAKHMLKVGRLWVLHVWELSGPPSTWQQQLHEKMLSEPVFAVISGAYGPNYAPVRNFCEADAVPCILPNLEYAPAEADNDFHTIYFSRGVGLEADLVAHDVMENSPNGTVVAVYREDDAGAAAAKQLAQQLKGSPAKLVLRPIAPRAPAGTLRTALEHVPPDAAVALWLRPQDLAELGAPPSGVVYVSGIMGQYEAAPLSSAWRKNAKLVFNVGLPEERRVRLDYAHGWFRVRRIPEIAFKEQADTMLACGILSETVKHLIDAFVPDYLIERIEDTLEHRLLTGYYDRLTLGPRQRFAAKGAYFAAFTDPEGTRVRRVGEWQYP